MIRRLVTTVAAASLLAAGVGLAGGAGVASGAAPGGPSLGLFRAHSFAGAAHASSGSGSVHAANLATAGLEVVASGLNQPHGLTIGANGDLYVADAGDGLAPSSCTDGGEVSCADASGTIDRVTPGGTVTHVATGLSSVAGGGGAAVASAGVAGVAVSGNKVFGVVQDQNINATTGADTYGPAGATLGDLVSAPLTGGATTKLADLAAYEAANNPDGGAGSGPGDPAIDSDPYGIIAYHGGFAVADAAANDVLFVSAQGAISVLAVLPLIAEPFMGGTVMAQGVPTSLAIGPDGDLYVGELGGGPNDVGDVNVYRINMNLAKVARTGAVTANAADPLTVVASGLTMIGGIAFDPQGNLLVLEIDTAGLGDENPLPVHGALIRITPTGTRTVLASDGLEFPLGLAVAPNGTIYISNYGVLPGHNSAIPGVTGEIVKIGGYRMAAADGGVFDFGSFGFYGSMGGVHLNAPVVGLASDTDGPGYWLAASDGGVFNFGHAAFHGSLGNLRLNAPVVGITATPDGGGYWLVASDGGVFSFGDAPFLGSEGGVHLDAPVVAMAATPDGQGYYLFASDGGVFTFGDATFAGSLGNMHLNAPIVGGAVSLVTGAGYTLVASDGGVFTFGDAAFHGSLGNIHLNAPVVGIQLSGGGGYVLAAKDGGVFTFGDAAFSGSLGGVTLASPVVGIG